jgi:hypothetical protein
MTEGDPLELNVRIVSPVKNFQLDPNEVEALRRQYHPQFHIMSTPEPVAVEDSDQQLADSEYLWLYIFAATTLGTLVANLLQGALAEAGADLYRAFKAKIVSANKRRHNQANIVDLLAELMARNDAHSYSLRQDVYIGCALNKQYAVIRLRLDSHDFDNDERYSKFKNQFAEGLNKAASDFQLLEKVRADYARQIRPLYIERIKAELTSLTKDWDSIIADIDRFHVGADMLGWSRSGFHLIEKTFPDSDEREWTIQEFKGTFPPEHYRTRGRQR